MTFLLEEAKRCEAVLIKLCTRSMILVYINCAPIRADDCWHRYFIAPASIGGDCSYPLGRHWIGGSSTAVAVGYEEGIRHWYLRICERESIESVKRLLVGVHANGS